MINIASNELAGLRVKMILLALSGLAAAGFGSGPRMGQAMMVIQRAKLFSSCSAAQPVP